MSIYNVDFNITTVELLPVHKRVDNIENILYSLLKPLNENETFFTWLREGSGAPDYNPATVYVFGETANYQRRSYYRNEFTIGYSAGIAPNNTTYWTRVLDNNIGLSTRIRFTPQKILMEYALNIIFGTSFNQPPALSDIYIENNNTDDSNFFIGQLDIDTANISETDQLADYFIAEIDGNLAASDFTVFVPVAVWTALAATTQERNNIILSVVNKLKLFGYIADVQTY